MNSGFINLYSTQLNKQNSFDLKDVTNVLGSGVIFLGAVMIVIGAINLGLCIKDGMQGGGGQLAGAIALLAGGGIVCAAGVFFTSLDTSWIK